MRREQDRLRAAGLAVVLIGLGAPEEARDFRAALKLPFPVLCDPEQRAYRRYGLLHMSPARELSLGTITHGLADTLRHGLAASRNQDMLQLGGTFVVDRDGIIRFVHRAERMHERPAIDDLLRAAP